MMQVVCKMYLGDVVESARRIQAQWAANGENQVPEDFVELGADPSAEDVDESTQETAKATDEGMDAAADEGAEAGADEGADLDAPAKVEKKELSVLSQHRRQAPLRPEHLREAYRRRRVAAENGGAMGSLLHWNQQTQSGLERFAPRAGGRRIFR